MTRAVPENISASWLPAKPIRKIASTIFSANREPRFGFSNEALRKVISHEWTRITTNDRIG